MPATTTVTLSDPTDTLKLGGQSQTIAGLAGSGVVDLGGVMLATTGTTTFAGQFSGAGTVAVTNGGKLTLTGNSAAGTAGNPAFTGSVVVAGSSLLPSTVRHAGTRRARPRSRVSRSGSKADIASPNTLAPAKPVKPVRIQVPIDIGEVRLAMRIML